ncbi:MAG: AAA family ATPase [Caulobacter sp.]
MNLNPGKTSFTDGEHTAIRKAVETIKANDGLTEAAIAREADIPASTLNSYLKGRYQGQNDPVAQSLHRWLEARKVQAELRRRLPVSPTFQPLATSQMILSRLHYARAMGRMVVLAGVPGVSKTATARQYCQETPRAWLATIEPASGGVPTMLLEVLAAMGIDDARGTPQQLARKVVTKAVEAESIILIDEAQHLSDQAVEQLRAINDRARAMGARVGIALLGNEAAYSKIGPTGNRAAFAQVSSRIANRRYIIEPAAEDVAQLARAYAEANREVIGPAEVDFLIRVAKRPGGLRNVEMTFEGALIAAFGNEEPLQLQHLQGAFSAITDLQGAA